MGYELDPAYKQVPERIADFKAKHPEGCLRPADPVQPYRIEEIGGRTFIVYVAAAYKSPDDPLPGIGVAYEPFPGKTPYTRDSELQNAETSAWGRAIVAALASESKAIASAEDVRNRQADAAARPTKRRQAKPDPAQPISPDNARTLIEKCTDLGIDVRQVVELGTDGRTDDPAQVLISEIPAVKAARDRVAKGSAERDDVRDDLYAPGEDGPS